MPARTLAIMLAATLAVAGAVPAEETARQILDRRKALDDTTRHWNDRHEKLTLRISGRGSRWHSECDQDTEPDDGILDLL